MKLLQTGVIRVPKETSQDCPGSVPASNLHVKSIFLELESQQIYTDRSIVNIVGN